MNIKSVFFVLCFICTTPSNAQARTEIHREAINNILDQYGSDNEPGLAIGVVKDGNIIYENYKGYADLTHNIKVTKDTRFNIASNAKQFTALSVLQLIDAGKLNLEDDIRIYFPELFEAIAAKITISNLLSHTSGIRDYCDLIALQGKTWWKQFIDNDDAMAILGDQKDLNFNPGTEYMYSNSNYILLAELVRKVTNQDFNAFAVTMFESLNMPNTSFFTHFGTIIPNRARPYGNWGGWTEEPTITGVHGDGALYSTLQDQLQWERIVQDNNGSYLTQQLINTSQTPLESAIDDGYGYGLFFDTFNALDYVFHDGVTAAFNNTFLRFPDKNISIVVMTNNRNIIANTVAWEIALHLLEIEKGTTRYPGDPDQIENLNNFQQVLGNYKNDAGSIIRIVEKDGALYRELYQRDPVKLIQEEGGLFEYETIKGLKMNFSNIGTPAQQFTIYLSSQMPNTYYKLPDSHVEHLNKKEIAGRFYNDETDTEIILKYKEGNTYALTKNGRERNAELILADYLRMNSYEIKVLRDEQNRVVGLNVKNARIKNVIFNKT